VTVSALAEHIADVPLIDQHAHGCWLAAGDRSRFENALNEANIEPLADFDSGFDTQLGFAVRAHCAPMLSRRTIGNAAVSTPKPGWRRSFCAQPASATG
jgi:predicted TIM-barrel fold metal-dependent hydrolase